MITLIELEKIDTLKEFRNKLLELNADEGNSFIEVKAISEKVLGDDNLLDFRINEILKAICALANVAGGMVIVGPNDGGFRKKLKKNLKVLAKPKIDEVYKKIQSIWKENRIRPKIPGIDSHIIPKKGAGCIVIHVPPSPFLHAADLKLLNPGGNTIQHQMVYMMRGADSSTQIPPELLPGFIKQRGIPQLKAKHRTTRVGNYSKRFELTVENIGNAPLINMQATLSCQPWDNGTLWAEDSSPQGIRPYTSTGLAQSGDIPFLKVIASKGVSRYYCPPGYVILPHLPQILLSFNYRKTFSGELRIYGENISVFSYDFTVEVADEA